MIDTSFINTLIEDLGFYTIMIPLLVIATIFTLPKFVDSTTYFKSRKIKYMNEALESNWVDTDSKRILSENISRMYLSSALNIKANKKEVKEILKVQDILNQSFYAIEIYYALKILPSSFYNLPLDKIKEVGEDLLVKYRVNLMLINFTILSMCYCYIYFIYYLIDAIKNNIFFSRDYLLNEFSFIIGVLVSTLAFILFYPLIKEFKSARKIIEYYISSLE